MNDDDFAQRFLDKGREIYEQGDRAELLYCLGWCIRNRAPIPEWLRQAFNSATHAELMGQIKSWDEVFGRPLGKGKHLNKKARDIRLAPIILYRVQKRQEAGDAIGKKLFDAIGKECGINATDAEDLYRKAIKTITSLSDEAIINRTSNLGVFRKPK